MTPLSERATWVMPRVSRGSREPQFSLDQEKCEPSREAAVVWDCIYPLKGRGEEDALDIDRPCGCGLKFLRGRHNELSSHTLSLGNGHTMSTMRALHDLQVRERVFASDSTAILSYLLTPRMAINVFITFWFSPPVRRLTVRTLVVMIYCARLCGMKWSTLYETLS